MNRPNPPAARRAPVLVEALEPRIAPAGLLNESKFTSVTLGTPLLLDASGQPGDFQGITTGSGAGSGSYLLYLVTGKALVFTTDLNGNGKFDPNEITGIALAPDSQGRAPQLILFNDVNGDIATNLQPGHGVSALSNSGTANDGHVLLDTAIGGITIRTITAADLDPTLSNDTVANRLELTSFSIHGNIEAGGGFGGLTIDTSGAGALTAKFNGVLGQQLYTGSVPQVGGIYTGTAADNLPFAFTHNNPVYAANVGGTFLPFHTVAGEHGGDIANVKAASTGTVFSIGTLATGAGGSGARGGNISNVTLHGDMGGYQLLAGSGGTGPTGSQGGSIVNFNDLGTITGEAFLHSGDGGTGLLGAGGAGGTASFANAQIAAGVHVILGSGGDGVTAGGNGAGLPTATFITPETPSTPIGGTFLSTWHDIGDVGNTHPLADGTYAPQVIDFNGDHAGDAVFTTNVPGQVVVEFGDGTGAFLDNGQLANTGNAQVVLKVPGIINPVVTVGDFNGDGRPDIAVASNDPANFAGVYIFLNQIGTAADPVNGHNYTHSPVGDHPFSAPLQSALPSLPDQGYYEAAGAVFALAAGDFTGSGVTDLAYVQRVFAPSTTNTPLPEQIVGYLYGTGVLDASGHAVLNPATHRPEATGYFFANAGAPGTAAVLAATPPPLNLAQLAMNNSMLLASSLGRGNLPDPATGLPAGPEHLFFGLPTDNKVVEFYNTAGSLDQNHLPFSSFLFENTLSLVKAVDTNRMTGGMNKATTDGTLQTFTVQDITGNGLADVVALTKTPANFLVTFQSSGAIVSGAPTSGVDVDNGGIFLGDNQMVIAIAPSDARTPGLFNGVGALTLPSNSDSPVIQESFLGAMNATTAGRTFFLPSLVKDQDVHTIDTFYATAPTLPTAAAVGAHLHPAVGYGTLSPDTSNYAYADLFLYGTPGDNAGLPSNPALILPGLLSYSRYLTENGYAVSAGSGGNSQAGGGGNAGALGGALNATSASQASGAIGITFPTALSYSGTADLTGGAGGNGFTSGGIGGDVSGVTVRYKTTTTLFTSQALLTAGSGGTGNLGDGGRGGNLSALSIATGTAFTAGGGGNGSRGGTGGSILGNQTGLFDTSGVGITLTAGQGGRGALQGGTGGAISNWDSEFLNFTGSGAGSLQYTGGTGGGAAGGTGGAGGGILNSSPDASVNSLNGPLTLQTGNGGNGLSGGAGGALTTFVNRPTNGTSTPSSLTVETGSGGIGVSGSGGAGGVLTGFVANTTGLVPTFSGSGASTVSLARVVAGDGGISYGGAGGNGGSIVNTTAEATSAPVFAAAGAGGSGLLSGGTGGSVTGSTFNSAAGQFAKLLVVAGAGGDATASAAKDHTEVSDQTARAVLGFGGAAGVAGDGGSIVNVTQPTGVQTAVDLIAGNGGSTPNSGTPLGSTSTVGRGGSITGATLTGTVGSLTPQITGGVPTFANIKSYSFTDPNSGENITSLTALVDYVRTDIFGNFALNDLAGNVGIVAGAAGLVRGAQPAPDGINGSVQNIRASSIMSIVAGSVDAVAPVRVVSGLTVTNVNGVLGADESYAPGAARNAGPNGKLDYYDPTAGAVVQNLEAGFRLIDGAIYATTIDGAIRGPRVLRAATS